MNYATVKRIIAALLANRSLEDGNPFEEAELQRLITLGVFVVAGELMAINENLPMAGRGN